MLAPRVLQRGRTHAVLTSPIEEFAASILQFTTPTHRSVANSRLRGFATIGFARTLDCRGDRILAAIRSVLAALDQIVGALAKLFRFALREVAALIGFFGQIFARVFSGFRSKEDTHQRANTETYEEVCDLGTNIIRHENLRKNRNIATRSAQYELTAMRYSVWLSDVCRVPSCSTILSAVFRGMIWLNFSRPARRTFVTLPNSRNNFCEVRGPIPGMPVRA